MNLIDLFIWRTIIIMNESIWVVDENELISLNKRVNEWIRILKSKRNGGWFHIEVFYRTRILGIILEYVLG